MHKNETWIRRYRRSADAHLCLWLFHDPFHQISYVHAIHADINSSFFGETILYNFGTFKTHRITANAVIILLIRFRISTSTEAHNLCRSSVVSPRLANTDCKSKKNFRNNKKSGEKMLRNFRNFRNLFSFRGVINSDTPKRVSRFVTPLQGVSRFATP